MCNFLQKLLLFSTFAYCINGYTQTYSTTKYTLEDGLVQSQIRCVGQDKSGYLWFGSYTSGASRFDGKEFESFTLDNGLCANTIHHLLVDSKQNLWFGTYGDGICKYDGETFTNYSEEDGLKGGKTYSMAEMFRILIIAPGTPCPVLSALTTAKFPLLSFPAQ